MSWLYLSGADGEAESKCNELFGNRQKLALELIPIIAGRLKTLNEKSQGALLTRSVQTSIASERCLFVHSLRNYKHPFNHYLSTLNFIQETPEEHLPNFEDIESKSVKRMISVAKLCLAGKHGCASRIQTNRNKEGEFSKCQHLLGEFIVRNCSGEHQWHSAGLGNL